MAASCRNTRNAAHEKLNSALWIQGSAEYLINSKQCYRQAREKLRLALKDKSWTALLEQTGDFQNLPPAVILDIDQTVLNNAPFQARMIKEGYAFNLDLWKAWVRRARAEAVPGALDFVKYALSMGVKVFYLTNRHYQLEAATRKNLQKLGFPIQDKPDTILSKYEHKDWGSDKHTRRKVMARTHRILLLIGDDLSDFLSGAKVHPDQRLKLAKQYSHYWGERWITLPNPLHGSWEGALFNYKYAKARSDKIKQKYVRLKPFK